MKVTCHTLVTAAGIALLFLSECTLSIADTTATPSALTL